VINSICNYIFPITFSKGKIITEQGKKTSDLLIFYKGIIELIWEDCDQSKF